MASKIVILAAAATGYVLGSKAGKERYEQIKTQATRLWQNPKVQKATSDASNIASEQAPVVKDKTAEVAKKAAAKAKSATSHGDHEASTSEPVRPTPTPAGGSHA